MIDYITGEVTSETYVTVKKYHERFGAYRRTDGLRWINKFTFNEVKMLMLLGEFEDHQSHIVILSSSRRDAILEFLDISRQYFYRLVNSLVEKHALARLNRDELMLNPSYFYTGGSNGLVHRIKQFYILYNDIYGTSISYLDDEWEIPGTVPAGNNSHDK